MMIFHVQLFVFPGVNNYDICYLSISDINLILCNCCLNLFSIHAFSSGSSFYRSLLAPSDLLVSGLFAVYTRVTDVSSWGSSIIMILGIPSIASVSYLLLLISLVFVFNMWFKDLVCRSAFSGSFWEWCMKKNILGPCVSINVTVLPLHLMTVWL